jgi:hypothetical protein
MSAPRNHLAQDLRALRYVETLDAQDLETVAAMWEEASHDPELERLLTELDGGLVHELQRKPVSPRAWGRRRRQALWIGAVAAACVLAFLSWHRTHLEQPTPGPAKNKVVKGMEPQEPDLSPSVRQVVQARRDLEVMELPAFNWPLRDSSSRSLSMDQLD